MRIHLETQAKLYIQNMVKDSKLELVTSYILDYENSKNRSAQKKQAISKFIEEYESFFVGVEHNREVEIISDSIMKTGIKEKDSAHIACAIIAKCEYFITTDDRLLRYTSDDISIVTPGEFIRKLEVGDI